MLDLVENHGAAPSSGLEESGDQIQGSVDPAEDGVRNRQIAGPPE
jgi:hypothetical protein